MNRHIRLLVIFGLLALRVSWGADATANKRLYEKLGELTRRDPLEAMRILNQSIAENTNSWMLYYLRGGVHHALNQPLLALDDYGTSIALKAPGQEIYMQRAFEWLRLDRISEANDELDNIAALSPRSRPQLWLRGITQFELGRHEEAARQLVSGYNVNRNDVENSVWIMCSQARMEGLQKAREALLPADGDTRAPMAEIWKMFKGLSPASTVLEAARTAHAPTGNELPAMFYARFYIGLYLDLLGERRAAIDSIDRALEVPMAWNIMQEVARVHRDQLIRQELKEFHLAKARAASNRGGLGNFFPKLTTNAEVRVAFFGGSITAANGWRVETMKWLREAWPFVKFEEINAAIGGTGSDLGAFRFQHDVLDHKPDLIFLEFAVNDAGAEPGSILKSAEGILRQAWKANEEIDFCFIYTFASNLYDDLKSGKTPRAASAYELLASHYEIPSINVALPVAERVANHQLLITPNFGQPAADGKDASSIPSFSDDGVHPNAGGHRLYFEQIKAAITALNHTPKPAHFLREPIEQDNWSGATMTPITKSMLAGDWTEVNPDDPARHPFASRLPTLWATSTPGASLKLKFKGPVLYVYDIMGPDSGQLVAVIDGVTNTPIARFDTFSTYHRLASCAVATGLSTNSIHDARIYLDWAKPDKQAVIDREKSKPGFDARRFAGAALRIGAVMTLDGDVHE